MVPKSEVKDLAKMVDRLYKIRQDRYALQKKVDALKTEETSIETQLIDALPASDASGIAGHVARATITRKAVPVVEDWAAFYKYVKKTGQFELMQKRLSDSAVKERWDDGKAIPGVGSLQVKKVNLAKVGG